MSVQRPHQEGEEKESQGQPCGATGRTTGLGPENPSRRDATPHSGRERERESIHKVPDSCNCMETLPNATMHSMQRNNWWRACGAGGGGPEGQRPSEEETVGTGVPLSGA